MWTPFQIVLGVTMVVTGSINTLSVKWANLMDAVNSNGTLVKFSHPYLQSSFMFFGETLCFFVFVLTILWTKYHPVPIPDKDEAKGEEAKPIGKYSPLILLPPALCDVTATSIMYVALTLTSASSFQMLRGSIMIFVGILSIIFLKKRLEWFRWLGMFIILGGLVVVGVSDWLQGKEKQESDKAGGVGLREDKPKAEDDGGVSGEVLGDILVIGAQVVAACQFVYEEKYIRKYNIPALKVVGLEGIFGLITVIGLLHIFAYIPVGEDWGHGPNNYLEDPMDGFKQIVNKPLLVASVSLTIVSIAFFNFAGVSITRELSATTRKVLDTLRTLVIWAFSLSIGWQEFYYLQPVGFLLLVVGMFVYNDLLIRPYLKKVLGKKKEEENIS